jgi:hypothetical protein
MTTTTAAPPNPDLYVRYGLSERIFWTPRELAPILARSAKSIRESARNGHLRSSRQPGRTRPRHVYHRDQVVAWLESELDVVPDRHAPAPRPPRKPRGRSRAKRAPKAFLAAAPPTVPVGDVPSGFRLNRDGQLEVC